MNNKVTPKNHIFYPEKSRFLPFWPFFTLKPTKTLPFCRDYTKSLVARAKSTSKPIVILDQKNRKIQKT